MLLVVIFAIIAIAMAAVLGVALAYDAVINAKGALAVPNWLYKIHNIIFG